MSSVSFGLLIFAIVFGSAIAGILIRFRLPGEHLSSESKDVVKLAVGLVATMAALLLGLLVSTAKSSFDAKQNSVIQMSAKVAFLDRALAKCGPDAAKVRTLLHTDVEKVIDRIWPSVRSNRPQLEPYAAGGDPLFQAIEELSPQNEQQQKAKTIALQTAADAGQLIALLSTQSATALPLPLLIVVVFWLAIIFLSFGVFAPPEWNRDLGTRHGGTFCVDRFIHDRRAGPGIRWAVRGLRRAG